MSRVVIDTNPHITKYMLLPHAISSTYLLSKYYEQTRKKTKECPLSMEVNRITVPT